MIKIIFIGTLLLFLFGCQETPKTKTIATSDTLVIGGKIYEMETISKMTNGIYSYSNVVKFNGKEIHSTYACGK